MGFKDSLYAEYFTTHIRPRKGVPTLREFELRSYEHRKRLGKLLPADKSARLIDVGCGTGHLVWWLQQQGYGNAEGIDLSPEQIGHAMRLGVANVRQADLKVHLKENPEAYAAVFMRDVLEHFDREEILQILWACEASLTPGGIVVIQVPNAESPFFGRIRYGDYTHEVAFTVASLAQVLRAVGLRPLLFSSVGPLPGGGPKRAARYLLWKALEIAYKGALFAELGSSPGARIVTQGLLAVATNGDTSPIENE